MGMAPAAAPRRRPRLRLAPSARGRGEVSRLPRVHGFGDRSVRRARRDLVALPAARTGALRGARGGMDTSDVRPQPRAHAAGCRWPAPVLPHVQAPGRGTQVRPPQAGHRQTRGSSPATRCGTTCSGPARAASPCGPLYEAGFMWAYANDVLPFYLRASEHPVWFVLTLVMIPFWASLHFYFVHRLLHWKPLYRVAHALHHRNDNTGPWSGLSMHPVEHLLYLSSILIHVRDRIAPDPHPLPHACGTPSGRRRRTRDSRH